MKSNNVASGQNGYSEQYDALVADAYAASQLLAHQQLGVLALPSNPANTKTATLTVNGTAIVFTFVTSIGATAGNVLIGASAAATAQNLLNLLQSPQTTTSTGVALSSANQALLVFCGYALDGTSITIYSQNNSTYAPETSFTASTTATSGTYTANTMALYVEPGTYYIGITKVIYGGGNTGTFTAPSTHPRIDIVTLDSSGTLATTTGTESVSPAAPAYPANKIVLCEVTHSVGETSIFDNDNQTAGQGFISNDSRNFLAPPYISSITQVTSGIFLVDPGGEAQGAVPFQGASALQFLAPGTAGQFLTSGGASANPTWGNGAGLQHLMTSGFTAAASTGEQTIDTYSVPANSLGTAHMIHARYYFTGFGSSGTNAFRVYYGSSAVLTVSQASGVEENTQPGWVDVYVMSGGTTSSQNIACHLVWQNFQGQVSTAQTQWWYLQSATSAVDSTTAQTFKITTQSSTTSNVTVIPFGFVEYL